jgi:hypothetical protein
MDLQHLHANYRISRGWDIFEVETWAMKKGMMQYDNFLGSLHPVIKDDIGFVGKKWMVRYLAYEGELREEVKGWAKEINGGERGVEKGPKRVYRGWWEEEEEEEEEASELESDEDEEELQEKPDRVEEGSDDNIREESKDPGQKSEEHTASRKQEVRYYLEDYLEVATKSGEPPTRRQRMK